jgi:hypothetical protein
MKKIEDESDIVLFLVLLMFLLVLLLGIWAAVGTWAINTLLVLFSVNMVPFSMWQGFQVMGLLWLIGLMTRGFPRGRGGDK